MLNSIFIDFIFKEITDVEIHSPTITLKDGFHAKAGSKVLFRADDTKPEACFTFSGFGEGSESNKTNDADSSISEKAKKQLELEKSIYAFPNPNSGYFTVQVDKFWMDAKLTIYDVSGRMVSTNKVENSTENYMLDTGFYLLVIEKNNQKETLKIIIL